MRKEESTIRRVDNESSILRKDQMSKSESQRLFLSIPAAPPKKDTRLIRRYVE